MNRRRPIVESLWLAQPTKNFKISPPSSQMEYHMTYSGYTCARLNTTYSSWN